MTRERRLTYRFHHVYRMEIIRAMGVTEDGSEMKLMILLFVKAKNEGLLGRLWEEVESRHKNGKPNENPFKD